MFTEQVALVTGSTSNTALSTAVLLADGGARVLVAGPDRRQCGSVVDAVRARGGAADCVPVGLRDTGSAAHLVDVATGLAGRIDLLVNDCAGSAPAALYDLIRALAPTMAARGHGVIINVRVVEDVAQVDAGSRAVLARWTKSWAAEFGPHGVRVNTLSPGPDRRHAQDEIARAVAFLASDEAARVQGMDLPIDGGRAVF